ncbi:MAG: bacterial Ig-like domain-containing protein, partial [Bacilli bacterium]|nr:bacterial Ig-like domain-containing protein [Bacilli bacterium]
VYLGEYDAYLSDNYNQIELKAYYSGKTGRWYHGTNLELFHEEAFVINGGFQYDEASGEYRMSSYINGPTGTLAKGSFAFVKANEAPVHVANLPEDLHDDNFAALVENKVFVFDKAVPTPATADVSIVSALYAGATISIFENGYIEVHCLHDYGSSITDSDILYRGNYTAIDDADNPGKYIIEFAPYEGVVDGETMQIKDSAAKLVYDQSSDSISFVEALSDSDKATLSFVHDATRTPERHVPVIPDKWEADKVSAALTAIGASDALPKVANLKSFAISEVDSATQSFTITGVFASRTNAYTQYVNFGSSLREEYGFSMMFSESGNSYYYLSAHAQYELTEDLQGPTDDGYYSIVLTIKKHVIAYPETEINKMMSEAGYTDPIIDFRVDGAISYELSGSMLIVNLNAETSAASVMAAYGSLLTNEENKYTAKVYRGYPVYISEHEQIGLMLMGPDDGGTNTIYICFVDPASIPDTTYPTNKIKAALAGVTETYPEFSVDSVEAYSFIAPSEYDPYHCWLNYTFASGTDVAAINQRFISMLENDYHFVYTTGLNAIIDPLGENFSITDGYLYVSPGRQLAIRVGYSESYPDMIYIQFINLSSADDVVLAEDAPRIGALEVADGYTDTFTAGETFSFDGTVYAITADGATIELDETQYSLSDLPNMSAAGEYEVKVSLVDDPSISTTFTVTVNPAVVPESLLVEDYTDTYTQGETFAFDGTITLVYSNGETKELTSAECTVRTAGDPTRVGTFTVTFVYAENGKTVRAEITITVVAPAVPEELTIDNFTSAYQVGDHFEFDGTVTLCYSDGSEKELTAEDYTITGTVNTAEAGEYQLTIAYVEDGVTVSGVITITVAVPDPVEVEYVFQNTAENWVANDNATFKVWAWGGEYGEGA